MQLLKRFFGRGGVEILFHHLWRPRSNTNSLLCQYPVQTKSARVLLLNKACVCLHVCVQLEEEGLWEGAKSLSTGTAGRRWRPCLCAETSWWVLEVWSDFKETLV